MLAWTKEAGLGRARESLTRVLSSTNDRGRREARALLCRSSREARVRAIIGYLIEIIIKTESFVSRRIIPFSTYLVILSLLCLASLLA